MRICCLSWPSFFRRSDFSQQWISVTKLRKCNIAVDFDFLRVLKHLGFDAKLSVPFRNVLSLTDNSQCNANYLNYETSVHMPQLNQLVYDGVKR